MTVFAPIIRLSERILVILQPKMRKMENNDMKWKTLSQRYLIEKPWLTARVDKVELPTGAVIDEYYVLEYPDWVNTIAITKEGKFVFVRQYRYALGKTVNELCAGVIEKGEEPMAAARRELMEETGFGWWQLAGMDDYFCQPKHAYQSDSLLLGDRR